MIKEQKTYCKSNLSPKERLKMIEIIKYKEQYDFTNLPKSPKTTKSKQLNLYVPEKWNY